jgi:hypothetical protein
LPVAEIDYLKNIEEPYMFDLLLNYPQKEGGRKMPTGKSYPMPSSSVNIRMSSKYG